MVELRFSIRNATNLPSELTLPMLLIWERFRRQR
jgi:hypothetical protein